MAYAKITNSETFTDLYKYLEFLKKNSDDESIKLVLEIERSVIPALDCFYFYRSGGRIYKSVYGIINKYKFYSDAAIWFMTQEYDECYIFNKYISTEIWKKMKNFIASNFDSETKIQFFSLFSAPNDHFPNKHTFLPIIKIQNENEAIDTGIRVNELASCSLF